jgi:REP element-mobilizing transposase RayT
MQRKTRRMALSNDPPGYQALRRGRWSQSGQIYLVTAATAGRQPFFSDWNAASTAARAINDQAQRPGAHLFCWVLMPDHWHGLLQLQEGVALASVLRRIKGASARAVNLRLGRTGSVWMAGFHDRALRRDEDVMEAARYIVANPLRASLVSRIGDYPYWDAVWLPSGRRG